MRKRLVLFLGAGISVPYGLPSWQDLVLGILLSESDSRFRRFRRPYGNALASWVSDRFGLSLPALAGVAQARLERFLRRSKSTSKPKDFQAAIRRRLYRGFTTPELPTTLDAVADLVLLGEMRGGEGILTAITTNFDDLLEAGLVERGINCVPVTDGHSPNGGAFQVVHVHGFIPRRDRDTYPSRAARRQHLVFTEEQYIDLSLAGFEWSSSDLLFHLRHSTLLFVGSSLADPNIRRLLRAAERSGSKRKHFVLRLLPDLSEAELDDAVEDVERRAELERRRLPSSSFSKQPKDVRSAVRTAVKQVREYEEELFAVMNVEIIWVSDYGEIPTILHDIPEYLEDLA